MKIHKEGYISLIVVLVFLIIINSLLNLFIDIFSILSILLLVASVLFFLFVLFFFRQPKREIVISDGEIISPCDGEVVVIEETFVKEYFNEKRLQVSIFMSPFNIHSNFNPVSGLIKYYKYHPGKFYVAWLPKSSKLNERTSYVIETKAKTEIMVRQIAGFVARRIVHYQDEGDIVNQSKEFGFIKFGSRVDLLLPLGTKIDVKLNQEVRGSQTIISTI